MNCKFRSGPTYAIHLIDISNLTEEKQEYLLREKRVCNNPLQHCCIGQGRRLVNQHENVSQLYIKWSEPLANLNNLLEYLSEKNIPCNIWFVGFSMSGDHAIAALCELMRDHGYQLDGTKCLPYENDKWDEKDAFNCSMSKQGMPTAQYYQLVNLQHSSCPKVTIAHEGMNTFVENNSFPHYYARLGGVLVLNHGVHCKKPGCVTEMLKKLVEKRRVLAMAEQGWHILWRETEHQHFSTPHGYYKESKIHNKCHAIANSSNDYLNEEANEFLSNLALAKNMTIPVIPLAKASEPLYFMHSYLDKTKKTFDCTHYVYSPWRFEVTWDGMLQALKSQSKISLNHE
jgi:hypothetical protein